MATVAAPLLLASLAAVTAPPAEGPEPLQRGDVPIALVLSGGVSLGSYEAGLSWAVVRFSLGARSQALPEGFGAPRLVAVTGASAGSVNALLSAVAWCSESPEDSVDQNLIRDLWMSVGLDGLLPDDPSGYAPGDALLSSVPLLRALDRFEATLAEPPERRRFRPGCRLPVGVTVTRARAAEEELGGLAVRTQRFALPWRLEVSASGEARVVSQRLEGSESRPDVLDPPRAGDDPQAPVLPWAQVEQGILASAAFPLAFRARELCDCSARCPLANRVTTGSCEGPRGPISGLSCPARSAEGEPLTLCSHRYVDGGIFDNTPVGLGVELTQTVLTPEPLQPVTYVFIDPDLRRLRPVAAEAPPSEGVTKPAPVRENLESAVRLLTELVATSRNGDLSRTLRDGSWNVTTRGLLYDTAESLTSFAEVERQVAAALGLAPPQREQLLPRAVPSPAVRAATGQALLRCFRSGGADAEPVRRCARELLDAAGGHASASALPLSEDEVIALAESMAHAAARLRDEARNRGRRDPGLFGQEMIAGAIGMAFLADEIPRVVHGTVAEDRLMRFRGALLQTIQLGRALGADVARLTNGVLIDELQTLASDPSVGPAASKARAALLATPDVLFVPQDLSPVIDRLDRARLAPGAGRLLREIVSRGSILQAEIVRLNRLARSADALQHGRSERALRLSSRFAPITGSQLGNFGAFLDRPFREFDYYAGVYDASHAIAVAMCEASTPAGAPPPLRKATSASELDMSAPDTQRCIGRALDAVRHGLDLERSATAARVFRMLAAAELDASLGEAAARALEQEPAWSWVSAPAGPPDAAVVIVAEVLLSSRVPCSSGAESLCIGDLSFADLLSRLSDRGYRPVDASMRALLEDTGGWVRRIARNILDRSLERERLAPAGYAAPAVLLAHGVGEMWLRGAEASGPMPRLQLDPSTIPGSSLAPSLRSNVFAHLVPYRIDLDVARGGFAMSWLDPALWLTPALSLGFPITPVSYEAAGQKLRSSIGLLPTVHVSGISIGAGAKAAVRWNDGGFDAGGCVRLSVFQDRFGLEIGTSSFRFHDHDGYVAIGISDLNGAFFWLLRGGR